MIDTATEAPATAASTNVVSRIDPHGWLYAALVIVDVAKNAATVGIAIAALTVGSSWAAAIRGMRNRPISMTAEVQTSGDVIPVSTDSPVNTDGTESTATSAASTSSVTRVRPAAAAGDPARSAHALQHPTITT